MSYADQVFIDMCRDIIDNGVSTEGEKVRPKWEDGELVTDDKDTFSYVSLNGIKTYKFDE